MNRLIHRLFFLIIALVVLCSTAQADPAIWQVKGKHNTLYLLGTIHMLPSDEQLAANINSAYREAEQLLMEIDMDDIDPLTTQMLTMQLGLLPEGQHLAALLDIATQRKLHTAASEVGLDSELLARCQPWLAALLLEQLTYAKQGFAAESGIEMQLTQQAVQDRKPIQGLETLAQQLSLLATLDQAAQQAFLRQTLDELEEVQTDLHQLLQAWRKGDTQHLQKILYEGFVENPQLFARLTTQRNQRWLSTLKKLLDQQTDDYLVAVGALHLIGDQGLVALLQAAGYTVTLQ